MDIEGVILVTIAILFIGMAVGIHKMDKWCRKKGLCTTKPQVFKPRTIYMETRDTNLGVQELLQEFKKANDEKMYSCKYCKTSFSSLANTNCPNCDAHVEK